MFEKSFNIFGLHVEICAKTYRSVLQAGVPPAGGQGGHSHLVTIASLLIGNICALLLLIRTKCFLSCDCWIRPKAVCLFKETVVQGDWRITNSLTRKHWHTCWNRSVVGKSVFAAWSPPCTLFMTGLDQTPTHNEGDTEIGSVYECWDTLQPTMTPCGTKRDG